MNTARTSWKRFLVVGGVLATVAGAARAELRHRYSFTTDATDSVGVAHGTVVDPQGTFATFSNGRLDLTAHTGHGSNQDFTLATTPGAYVDLPNFIISALGTAATFETWVNVQTNRTWAEIFSFGTSDAGENVASGAPFSRYITLIPLSGTPNRLRLTHRGVPGPGVPGSENFIDAPTALSIGVEHHLVAVWDQNDTAGGANPNGTQSLYLDGAFIGSGPIRPDIRLSNMADNNNWLGRSQWPDPLLDATINEFRIYNHALTPADVTGNFALGPDVVPEPSAIAAATAAAGLALMARRRRRARV